MLHKFQSVAEAIKALRDETGKTCVSVMLPLGHLTPGQQKDYKNLDIAVQQASDILEEMKSESAHRLHLALASLAKTITFSRNDKGIGIYVTDRIAYHVTFPFPVSEYVVVAGSFRLKELYQLTQYGANYHLLTISEKKARLFSGQDAKLHEVSNKYFPLVFEDEYEYAEPARSSSYAGSAHVKSFERDKRSVQKKRFEDFLEKVDEHLGHYLEKGHGRFLVCGTKVHTAQFLKKTRYPDKVLGIHQGGYDWLDESELAALVWPSIEKFSDARIEDIINFFKEKLGEGRCAQGLEQVWNALVEGRVDTLFMEKDFDATGYTPNDMPHLIQGQPPASPSTFHLSVANDLINMVMQEGGKVLFVEKGRLPGGEAVGAICRY